MTTPALSADTLLPELVTLASAPRWWVALSGGLDSSVLLHLLAQARLADPGLPPLSALHVNHGLQAGADDWQRLCERLARELDVPLVCESVQVEVTGHGLEAAAREARHGVFERHLGRDEILFTAHHRDDQVETLFLRLLRGAGLDGLAAMSRSRPLADGTLYRPLLDYPRSALERYARERAIAFVDDPSNSDTALDRNYLRRDVLPLLEARWPGYRETVARAAEHLRRAGEDLRTLAPAVTRCQSVTGDPGLELEELLALPDSLASHVLRDWLVELGQALAPEQAALREFLRQLREARKGRPRLDCGPLTLQRYRQAIYARYRHPAWVAPDRLPWEGEALAVEGVGVLSLAPASPGSTPGNTPGLALDWRRGGERCRLPGRQGSRTVKKILQELAVPPWWRDRVPLVYAGNDIVAIGDLCYCAGRAPDDEGGGLQVVWQRKTPGVRD